MNFGQIHNILFSSLVFAVMSFAVSCSEPVIDRTFVVQDDRTGDGCYRFSVDFDDSLCRYTLSIYTMIDAGAKAFDAMPQTIPLKVTAVSPSEDRFAETVGIDRQSYVKESAFSKQYEFLYRKGFTPVEYGCWTIDIEVIGEDRFPGLRGLGLKYTKE